MSDTLCEAGSVLIPGPAGRLEAVLACPDAPGPQAIGIICHPHPLHGGSLRNKVVDTLARALDELQVATLRFNFRGVGASEGGYADGHGEADDLRAVLDWVRERYPHLPVWLAGFSFGAYIALRVANEVRLDRLITVAPPINFFDFDALPTPHCPWLLVQGEADEIVPAERVLAWAAAQSPTPAILRMADVGHFFHGRLNALKDAVVARLMAAQD